MALQMMNASDEFDVQIIKGLIEIIAMEGPILTSRAFNLYAKKGGIAKLTPTVSKRIMAALKKALHTKDILIELDISSDKSIGLLWLPSMQRVIPREYGARGFSDIPASELGEVMFELADEVGQEKDKLYQKMVEVYGLGQFKIQGWASPSRLGSSCGRAHLAINLKFNLNEEARGCGSFSRTLTFEYPP